MREIQFDLNVKLSSHQLQKIGDIMLTAVVNKAVRLYFLLQ